MVNQYQKGQARPDDLRNLDDDHERKAFGAWWKNNAQKYEDKNPSQYANFEAFYMGDDNEPEPKRPQVQQPTKRTSQAARNAPRSTTTTKPTDKPKPKQSTPKASVKTLNQYPEIMTLEEVGEFLRLSRATLYRMMDKGELPGVRKIGGSVRIVRDELKNLL